MEKLELLTPKNSQIIFIDHQPQMVFGVQSIDRQVLKNNTVGLSTSRPRSQPSKPKAFRVIPIRNFWQYSRKTRCLNVPL